MHKTNKYNSPNQTYVYLTQEEHMKMWAEPWHVWGREEKCIQDLGVYTKWK
jgi:hypothetical protein